MLAVELVEGVVHSAGETAETIGAAEGAVEVEEDEAEAAVGRSFGALAEGFHVVACPVVAVEVYFYGHVVGELLDVDNLLNALVAEGIGGVGSEGTPLVEDVACAGLLYIAAVGRDLKLILVVGVYAVVGIAIALVIGLAQVLHTDIFAVVEDVDGFVAL